MPPCMCLQAKQLYAQFEEQATAEVQAHMQKRMLAKARRILASEDFSSLLGVPAASKEPFSGTPGS
jgi:hypothetical protein